MDPLGSYYYFSGSIVVSIRACHVRDPGSIPGQREALLLTDDVALVLVGARVQLLAGVLDGVEEGQAGVEVRVGRLQIVVFLRI